jgi:hypothetical protein
MNSRRCGDRRAIWWGSLALHRVVLDLLYNPIAVLVGDVHGQRMTSVRSLRQCGFCGFSLLQGTVQIATEDASLEHLARRALYAPRTTIHCTRSEFGPGSTLVGVTDELKSR